jgi:tRNA modification GTPase
MTTANDTIVAPATPPGRGALAIVRLSGTATRRILAEVFTPDGTAPLSARRPRVGTFRDAGGRPLDEGVALLWSGPRSYTGEDLAELTVHGAPAVVQALVAACTAAGARTARPGEFTLRALRNGKLDLVRAEAIGDLVAAETLEQARIATRQLRGEVGAAVVPLAQEVLDLAADVEAGLDFAEEEDLALGAEEIADRAVGLARSIDQLLGASEPARRVREGARVVLLGPPNAGKSSLFNRLCGEERAIVTAEAGTTRDLVEEQMVIEGLPVVLVDAAGVRLARGAAEAEGVRRALGAAGGAELVLDVYDLTRPERPRAPGEGARRLPVGTHADLEWSTPPAEGSVLVNAVSGEGVEGLRRRIAALLGAPGTAPFESVAFATLRHREAAGAAARALGRAAAASRTGAGAELVAVELRDALAALEGILGKVGPEELLGRIFARFCVGK